MFITYEIEPGPSFIVVIQIQLLLPKLFELKGIKAKRWLQVRSLSTGAAVDRGPTIVRGVMLQGSKVPGHG